MGQIKQDPSKGEGRSQEYIKGMLMLVMLHRARFPYECDESSFTLREAPQDVIVPN